MRRIIASAIGGVILLQAFAAPARADWRTDCVAGQRSCETGIFYELAKLFRRSGEEKAVIAFIQEARAFALREVWPAGTALPIQVDRMGNVVIQVPGTGRFATRTRPEVALQAHMDMVLDKKGALPGEDLNQYFRDGVPLEVKDGWIQSVGQDRSIGADNSVGVAMALRYLLDRKLEHPPLELIFTVMEEVSLQGAFGYEPEVLSSRMVNLDGMTAGAVTIGSQGATRSALNATLENVEVPAGYRAFRIGISNLQGGHSGVMIHRSRGNSIQVIARTLQRAAAAAPGLMLIEIVGGDLKVLNKIPNLGQATFAVAGSALTADLLRQWVLEETLKHADEDPLKFKAEAEELTLPHAHAATAASTQELIRRLLGTPHGVYSRDERFPDGVNTSTNFAAVSAQAGAGPRLPLAFGFMTRSFGSATEVRTVMDLTRDALSAGWAELWDVLFKPTGTPYDPWMVHKDSLLLKLALEDPYYAKTVYFTAGIEASAFAKKKPELDIICVGAEILNAHTATEKVRAESIPESSEALLRLLRRLP
jgi:dipeptidase D